MPTTEAFPLLPSPSGDKPTILAGPNTNDKPRRRRKSSGLGEEIRVGNTSGQALATLDVQPPSPNTLKAQHDSDNKKPFSKRRKARTLLRRWRRYALKHTWVTPLVLLGIILLLFLINPTPSNPLHHFIFLSYSIPPEIGSAPGTPLQYGKGKWDLAFVGFYIIVLSFTREFIMQIILRPLARYNGQHYPGLRTRSKQSRFMEQMYTALYFGCAGPWGLYVMSRSPVWYFNTAGMYAGFPHTTHEGVFKFYYLFQAAYWAQQAIVMLLGMEKPRKDFKELVGHHIVTLFLIALSYRFHFTYMGLGVFITHDISDCVFAISKVLNYLDHPIVGPFFAFFIGCWCYLRHYVNLRILYSEFNEFKTVGPYELNWETQQYKCDLSHYVSTALLGTLQAINLFWLYHIIRIAIRYVFTGNREDDRSENEEETEAGEEEIRDALTNQRVVKPAAQKVFANGTAGVQKATSSEIPIEGAKLRRSPRRKA